MLFLPKHLVLFPFLHKKGLVKFDLMFAEKEGTENRVSWKKDRIFYLTFAIT